jgi:hypothetical protein
VARPSSLDVEALYRLLKRALRKGARASRLVRYCPDLVELLSPEAESPELTIYDRALHAEDIVRAAIQRLGDPEAEALSILYCLKPGTTGMTLESRRQHAAGLLGILPDTLRRDRHEGAMVWDMSLEVYRVVVNSDAP